MLTPGTDIPAVAAILCHSRNSTALDVYAGAVPQNLAFAVDTSHRALRGVRNPDALGRWPI